MGLLEHRDEYVRNGRLGSLLSVEQLSKEEADLIWERFVEVLAERAGPGDVEAMTSAYADVLAEFGVMCPHPELAASFRGGHRYCDLCRCPVILPR